MRRSMLALAVALVAMVAPAGSQAALGALPVPAVAAIDLADEARELGAGFAGETTIAGQLAGAMRLAGHDTTAPSGARSAVTFDQAMRSFYRAAGIAPRSMTAPPATVAAGIAPVIAATADAIDTTNRALSALQPGERAWAARHVDLFELPWTDAAGRLQDIASRVDVEAMGRAAVAVADAIDRMPTSMSLAVSWIDPTGLIEIGSTGTDSYSTDRVLQIDLGGNDQYYNSAGAIGEVPGNAAGIPVSIVADVGGDDFYYGYAPNQADNTLVVQGTGIGGIGLLADRWGNDAYIAQLSGSYPTLPCAGDIVFSGYPGRFPQAIFAQGTGALGVGGLIDLSGTDYTAAGSYVNTVTPCHFVRSYVHAQAAGIARGVGVLIDDASNDYRSLDNYARTIDPQSQDAVAGTYGQGFGAGGAGILVDKEGDDYNWANTTAAWNGASASKGSFATTFVQGAVAGLTHLPGLGSLAGATPALGVPVALPCSVGSRGGQGGQSSAGPCELFGVGLHIDLLGTDTFHAAATAQHGPINQCFVGSVALVGAQGAAAWGGLASLINLDVNGNDAFFITPKATGGPCYSDATRAVGVGQGFGGAVRYPIWDDPNAYYSAVDAFTVFTPVAFASARVTLPAIGILVSGGPPCAPGSPKLSTSGPEVFVPCDQSLQTLTSSNDRYQSAPYAENQQGSAIAESWVQGSGGRPRTTTPFGGPAILPSAMGIGILADAGGDDEYLSYPSAYGTASANASSVAQGATQGGIGALIDALGDDLYQSAPSSSGSVFSLHQGDAQSGFGEPIMPIAILADAGGNDTYGPVVTCQANGGLGSYVVWGDLGTCGAQAGTLIIGLDALSGIGL